MDAVNGTAADDSADGTAGDVLGGTVGAGPAIAATGCRARPSLTGRPRPKAGAADQQPAEVV